MVRAVHLARDMAAFLYSVFFLSGAAALAYEVTWGRSLGLVFGASRLSVTTVLSVFMGGLALGSALLGKRAESSRNPLRLYAALELGIAASALVALGLFHLYPVLYPPLARAVGESPAALTLLRVGFAVVALLVPTTLMGGTLPVASRVAASSSEAVGRQLSRLYGINTLGSVFGTLATGFFLLEAAGTTATLACAACVNAAIGASAWILSSRREAAEPEPRRSSARAPRLMLWGAGISGLCALGYEVLWTRMLSVVSGTSVYSFATMLAAFLSGIAIGSGVYAVVEAKRGAALGASGRSRIFAWAELGIAVSALAATLLMRDLPSHAVALQKLLTASGSTEFGARQAASFAVAFAYMFVPAFFMGVAFPAAASAVAAREGRTSSAVGRVLTVNTVGSILGSALTGFVLIRAFGIERSLQLLMVLNAALGLLVLASARRRALVFATAAAAACALALLALFPERARFWDQKYFAIYVNANRGAYETPEKRRDALANTDVLYYREGSDETISVIRPKGAHQSFIVNGRPEASTAPVDVQCQRTLGHLPMLLHPDPKSVFVLGTGTGMTLGATALYPEMERITLAELEPDALDAARTFAEHNHRALDDPRLKIVLNDGRNFLATTQEKYDVITADPIHPWSGGAAYLYTSEYFDTVARHLRPGGVASQWLPIYELSPDDVKLVLRTFSASFRHVAIWLTYYDAELVGSDAPLQLDERTLERRFRANPALAADLAPAEMDAPEKFLSYFLAEDDSAVALAGPGPLNTDDNLRLEFSAPRSMGVGTVGRNVQELSRGRESVAALLAPSSPDRVAFWAGRLAVARKYDLLHAGFVSGEARRPELERLREELLASAPDYAPLRFLEGVYRASMGSEPTLVEEARFPVAGAGGERWLVVSAVSMKIGPTREVVVFANGEKRAIYGQRYFDGEGQTLDERARSFAHDALAALGGAYAQLAPAGRAPDELTASRVLAARLAALEAPAP